MSLGDNESPAYNYAQEVIFTPLVEWAVKLWAFWSEPGTPNPGTLAAALAEPVLIDSCTSCCKVLQTLPSQRHLARANRRPKACGRLLWRCGWAPGR